MSFSIRVKVRAVIYSTYPVNTERKLNVHKTFRRRPGRLLNVLCTFNLHPVSTGYLLFSSRPPNHPKILVKCKEDTAPVLRP